MKADIRHILRITTVILGFLLIHIRGIAAEKTKKELFNQLRMETVLNPQNALHRIDSLDFYSTLLPLTDLEILRAYAYRAQAIYSRTLYYAGHVMELAQMDQNTHAKSLAYILLAESSVWLNRLKESMQYIQDGLKYAQVNNDTILWAYMTQMNAFTLRKSGQIERSYEEMKQAIHLLNKHETIEHLHLLAHIYGYLSTCSIEDQSYDLAWAWCLKQKQVIQHMERKKVLPLIIDIQYGYYYSKMAFLSYKNGKKDEARKYYLLFQKTEFSHSLQGKFEINNYLIQTGEFKMVLLNNQPRIQSFTDRDTLGTEYINTLIQNWKAYRGLEDCQSACHLMERVENIRKTLRIGQYRQDIKYIQQQNQSQIQVERQEEPNNYLLIILTIGGLVIIIRTVAITREKGYHTPNELENQIKKETDSQSNSKNTNISCTTANDILLVTLSDNKKEEKKAKATDKKDKILFNTFNQQVISQKLYLNYQSDRDFYTHLMGVDRNRFARIIKQQTGDNLSRYL